MPGSARIPAGNKRSGAAFLFLIVRIARDWDKERCTAFFIARKDAGILTETVRTSVRRAADQIWGKKPVVKVVVVKV